MWGELLYRTLTGTLLREYNVAGCKFGWAQKKKKKKRVLFKLHSEVQHYLMMIHNIKHCYSPVFIELPR